MSATPGLAPAPGPDGVDDASEGVSFSHLAEVVPQIVWVSRPDGTCRHVNGRWLEYTGLDEERSLGPEAWAAVVHPDDLRLATERFAAASASGEPYQTELRLRRGSDGAYRWFLVRALPVKDGRGRVVEWVGTSTDIEDSKRADEVHRFLAEAGELLASSLDFETTLGHVARLAVPRLADWCAFRLVEADGSLRRAVVVHEDPAKVATVDDLFRLYPPDPDSPGGTYHVLRTGRPEFIPEINDAVLEAVARDARHLAMLRGLGLRSSISVPLVARGRAIGVLSLVHAESGRRYGPDDLATAEELARRAALAVDNARLYRESQDALRRRDEAQALVEALLAAAPGGVAFLDRDLRYVRINRALAALNGLDAKDHEGRLVREVLGDDAARFEPILRRVLETGEPMVDWEFQGRPPGQPDREGAWSATFYPALGPDGSPLGVGVMIADVTERKRAEDDLRQSERRHRTLTDAVLHLMWSNDASGRTVYFNRRWQEYTGRPVDSLNGLAWIDLIHPDDIGGFRDVRRAAIKAGVPYEHEYRVRRHDGAYRWHLGRIVPVKDNDGRVEGWFGTATDIHDRREVEETLRAARDAAEAASRAKSQFLAVLSHELRNPLNPALASVSALLDDPATPAALHPALEVTRRNIELEARLIDDLLDVTRIAQGKFRLDRERVDAHELIRRAVAICEDDVAAKRLRLDLDLSAARRHVDADPARLQQIVWNLVKNAAKFTPSGGSISIRTRNEPDPGRPEGLLVVEVIDTGIGIENEALPRIFDAFEQADPSISRLFGGLGLGLAISRSLAEAHGGTLRASSTGRDRGSTFALTLPASPPAEAAAPRASGPDGPAPDPLRVLLVEDNLDSLRVMARLLGRRGHRVTTAACVAEALLAADGRSFDLLISDVGLPDGSGHDLARSIRPQFSLGAIALSGYGAEHDVRRSREAGFDAHLTKPVDFRKLEDAIRSLTPAPG